MSNKKGEKTCKIEQMSWREIITKYGIQLDGKNAHWICIEFPGKELIKECEILLEEKNTEGLIDFLEKNNKYFDKTKYIMVIFLNLGKERNELQNRNRLYGKSVSDLIERYEDLDMLLQDANSNGISRIVSDIEPSEKNPAEFEIQVVDIKRTLNPDGKRADKNKQKQIRLMRNGKLSIQEIIAQDPLKTLYGMEIDEMLIRNLSDAAIINIVNKGKSKTTNNMATQASQFIKENKPEYIEELARLIDSNLEYMDIEGLLTTSLVTNIYAISYEQITLEEQRQIQEYLKRLINFSDKVFEHCVRKEKKSEYEKFRSYFNSMLYKGEYITKRNGDVLFNDINNKTSTLEDLTDTLIGAVLEKIPNVGLLSLENFRCLINRKIKTSEELFSDLKQLGSSDMRIWAYAIQEHGLSRDDILELYLSKKLTLEQIREIENLNGAKFVSEDELFENYRKNYSSVEVEEGTMPFDKLAQMTVTLKEPLSQEKIEEQLYSLDSEDDDIEVAMMTFYKNYLLDAEKVLESCGTEYLQFFRPADIKRLLYEKQLITLDDVEQAVRKMNFEDAYHFICRVCDDDNQGIDRLMQAISVEEDEKNRHRSGKTRGGKNNISRPSDMRRIKPETLALKYKFFRSLDSDYSSEYYKNGYEVFKLPNSQYESSNDSCVIIEPMVDKTHGEVRPAQNKAMWIIPLSLWEQEKANIVTSDYTIDVGHIRQLKEGIDKDRVKRIIHTIKDPKNIGKEGMKTGWTYRTIAFLSTNRSEQYSEEELEEIRKIADNLEKAMVKE